MNLKSIVFLGVLLSFILTGNLYASTQESITLQLKWTHAFQFAGYYAAKEKGYYKEAGLDVNIVEATPSIDPIKEVLEGRAQYGVGTNSLLLSYAQGKPVIVLAVIFQQSPYEIHTSPSITSLHDLIGKKLMMEPQSEELLAYLQKEGISPDQIQLTPHSFNPQDLIDGKTDAMSGYVTNEPYYYSTKGFTFRTFTPRSAGIDFYGDNLFTTQNELASHPERVKAFREASMRGWAYAKEHKQEIIDLILLKYNSNLTKEHQLFEADQMIPLLQPDLIEIGYMNPARWEHIAATLATLGMIPNNYNLESFIYTPDNSNLPQWVSKFVLIALLVIICIGGVLFYFIRLNKRLREQQELIKQTNAKYQHMVENVAGEYCFYIHDTNGIVTYVSNSIYDMLGYTVDEAKAHFGDFLTDHPINSQIYTSTEAGLQGIKQPPYLAQFAHKNGTQKWIMVNETPMFDHDGEVIGIEGIMHDVTPQKEYEAQLKTYQEKLETMAHYDSLTGLPNRMLLLDRLAVSIAHSNRDDTMLTVFFLDIDGFKAINDTYGHQMGDELLKMIAERMKLVLREEDTIARLGGDEFVGVMSRLNTQEDIVPILNRLLELVSTPVEINDASLQVSASIGVTFYPQDAQDSDLLLRNADHAMYLAKQLGKNRYCFFNASTKNTQ